MQKRPKVNECNGDFATTTSSYMAFLGASLVRKILNRRTAHQQDSSELELAFSMRASSHGKARFTQFVITELSMPDHTKLVKSWRQLAAEVAQEDDPKRLAELTDKLLLAMEEEKRLADARLQLASKPLIKLRSE